MYIVFNSNLYKICILIFYRELGPNLNFEVQVQGLQKVPGPGPDLTMDSVLLPSAFSTYPLEQLNNTTPYPARSAPLSELLSPTAEGCIGSIKCGIDINWLQEMLVPKNNEKDQTFKHYLNVEQ